jgi:hypothetical protein
MYIFENYDGGRWKELELIGRGTFGAVYKICKDEYGVESIAALKVIPIPHCRYCTHYNYRRPSVRTF